MAKLSATELGLPEHARCPFCDGHDTELHSAFGSQLSVATYWCRRCATAFESFKGDDAAAGSPATHPERHRDAAPTGRNADRITGDTGSAGHAGTPERRARKK